MKIARQYTSNKRDAYNKIEFVKTSSEIRNPDGSTVFSLKDFEVPKAWSQVASDVLAQKYFRKAGVPVKLKKVPEKAHFSPNPLLALARAKADPGIAEGIFFSVETLKKNPPKYLAGTWV